jgi:hypothetical protein
LYIGFSQPKQNQNNMEKTHWKVNFSPDYIGAYAFQPGEEKIVTIKSVSVESVAGVSGKKEDCMVVRFVESEHKPLICNATNAKAITKVVGSPYIEDWAGVKIQLYTTEVSAFGDTVEAVRVRTKAPKITLPNLTPDSPKWSSVVTRLKEGGSIDAAKQHFKLTPENEQLLLEEVANAPSRND